MHVTTHPAWVAEVVSLVEVMVADSVAATEVVVECLARLATNVVDRITSLGIVKPRQRNAMLVESWVTYPATAMLQMEVL